jgi:hypothetical protein
MNEEKKYTKTILTNVNNSFFVRNILRSDVFGLLESDGTVRLVLLVPEDKCEYYMREFPQDFVVFDKLPQLMRPNVERFFSFIEKASIHTHTAYMLMRTSLHREGTMTPFAVRWFFFILQYILWQFGRFRWWRNFIRLVYLHFNDETYSNILEKYKPDLIFCSNMIYAEDHVLAKSARVRGIKIVGMTLSWDNFYSKTLLRVHPDKLLVHTDRVGEQAVLMADFPEDKIKTVGIPQYDHYFQKKHIMNRNDFFSFIGADPSKKLIVYAFSGKAGLGIEFDIVDILGFARSSGAIRESNEVLIRPYPRYDFPEDVLNNMSEKYGFLARRAVAHVGGKKGNWEFDADSLVLLTNTLAHADVIVTLYSTFFIEAAIFDKPLVAIEFDGYKRKNYWNSSRRFFDWDHLADIKPLDGVWISKDKVDFMNAINTYIKSPHLHEIGRRRIVEQQCWFTDGKSGERAANALLSMLSNI